MKKVMCFGSFDVLHDGHRSLFSQAKQHGDYLVVVVARDKTYTALRNHEPMHDEDQRLGFVSDEELVDKAMLGDLFDVYRVIGTERPDVIALGYDQQNFIEGLEEKIRSFHLNTKIVRLHSFNPEKMKSSLLKKIEQKK